MATDIRSEKKHAILQAAARLFREKGFDHASMDDIAAATPASKRTVYNYFPDKDALFREIVLGTTDHVNDLVASVSRAALLAAPNVEMALAELCREFLRTLLTPETIQLRRLVIANADRFPDISRDWYERGFERVLGSLAGAFEQLSAEQKLTVEDPLRAACHFAGLALWIPMNEVMFKLRNDWTEDRIRLHSAASAKAFLSGYGAPAG